MRWTERAVEMEKRLEFWCAPPDIIRAGGDAVQHFVWATDCRRQAINPNCTHPGWGAKADRAHRAGKKAFKVAQTWLNAEIARRITPT